MKTTKISKIALGILSIVALTSCGETKKTNSTVNPSTQPTTTKNNDEDSTSTKKDDVIENKYTVTFSLNYTGASTYKTEEVKLGETVAKPTDPTRDGYIFNGWYEDDKGTSLYNFSTVVTADITLYANWVEGNAADYIQVNFYYNYEGASESIYYTSNIKKKRKVAKPTNPTRNEYYFDAWYTDAKLTTKFDFDTILNESTSLYAGWKKLYVFEAEDTDFDGKNGFGYSANVSETEMIENDGDGSLLASNGYFVSYLYYNGAFLEWKINAAEACDNVTFITRLSAEFFDINVNTSTYDMTINGTSLTGYDIALTGIEGTMKKLPFTDYVISSSVSLVKGENTIRMTTKNNNSHAAAGTYHAEAPMIDCIKLATNETLTFTPVEGNY